jgi:hypothetical protein
MTGSKSARRAVSAGPRRKHHAHKAAYAKQGKRVFIKDIAYYLFSPDAKATQTAPSLSSTDEPENPTILPDHVLRRFDFTFLIRHPRRSIPSYYRCTVPPLSATTGFHHFLASEAGYLELRSLFDHLVRTGLVDEQRVVVVDADDLLDRPEETLRAYCARVGIDFTPAMLAWSEDDTERATEAFEKWNGFHNDALGSSSLKPRSHGHVSFGFESINMPALSPQSPLWWEHAGPNSTEKKTATVESEDKEWAEKFGQDAQRVIRACVEENVPHYEYLRRFVLKV